MEKDIKILIIDNRPMVVQGIKTSILSTNILKESVKVNVAYNYEDALKLGDYKYYQNIYFDIIILDVDINFSNSKSLAFGEDYLNKLKVLNPKSKIIALIRKKDNYRIYNIFRKLKPDGFIVENELDFMELKRVMLSVINRQSYFSKTIISILRKNNQFSISLDDFDRKILYFLSKGIKTKNLTDHILLSLSCIEKRKQRLKDVLQLNKGSDEQLVKEASIREII